MVRDWYPGYKGSTKQGDFTVLRGTSQGYLVKYTSGPWEGKYINMPREIGAQTHEIESLKLSIDQKDQLLQIFYDDYQWEHDAIYDHLERATGRQPKIADLVAVLRDEYPPLFQAALNKFFQKA